MHKKRLGYHFSLRQWIAVALILLMGLVSSLLTMWCLHLFFDKTVAKTSHITLAPIESCAGKSFDCYNTYLLARVDQADPAAAMADLKRIYNNDPYVKSQCHQLTHVIGHAAMQKYKTVKEAFMHGDSFCWSGYYHGVVEQAVKDMGADKIKADANDICAGFSAAKKYSFDHYNCVHGLGHGFMAVENINLFKALGDCDLLHDDWERTSCYGGVYMENIMAEARGETKSVYLNPAQPMYPCTAVDYKYKEQCYLMQTSYVLQHNQYNFATTFQLCHDLVDKDFVNTCYQSVGRDASGSTISDVARTKANCLQAPDSDGLMNCVLGAVRDFISYYHSDVQGKQLCEAFENSVTERCLQEVATYYATFR